jgi:S1-C subfamily serine protease
MDAQGEEGISMSIPPVVRVFATTQSSDYDCPWQAMAPENSSGSGVVVAENEILTGAHVVADATFLQVQKLSSPEKALARVKRICHDCDLALLEIEEDGFTEDIEPCTIGGFPSRSDKVTVIGFPVGGEEVSMTEGVVSRIEVQNYDHSQRKLLAVTVDAAINAGNSGGPVFKDGEVVGIAFQKLTGDADNIGEMVPPNFIRKFLNADTSDKQVRIPGLGVRTQNLESPLLRKHLKMSEDMSGVLVHRVDFGSSADGILQEGDTLLKIDEYPIANNGTVHYRQKFRTRYEVVLGDHSIGETITVDILRDGSIQNKTIFLKPFVSLIARARYDVRPTYYVYGGLVFQPLTRDFLSTWEDWDERAPSDFLSLYESGVRTESQQETVVLSRILADRATVGFESRSCEIILAINHRKVAHMKDLVEEISRAAGILEITTTRGTIVVDVEAVQKAQKRILDHYQISAAMSEDLRS